MEAEEKSEEAYGSRECDKGEMRELLGVPALCALH